MTVDPASPDFLALPPKDQALIWYFDIGWDEGAIAEELGVRVRIVDRWLNAEVLKGSRTLRGVYGRIEREEAA